MTFTKRETATLLAALRYWQEQIDDVEMNESEDNWMADSLHFKDHKPLTSEEIDELCGKINPAEPTPTKE